MPSLPPITNCAPVQRLRDRLPRIGIRPVINGRIKPMSQEVLEEICRVFGC